VFPTTICRRLYGCADVYTMLWPQPVVAASNRRASASCSWRPRLCAVPQVAGDSGGAERRSGRRCHRDHGA
jgi:hypothetical protein